MLESPEYVAADGQGKTEEAFCELGTRYPGPEVKAALGLAGEAPLTGECWTINRVTFADRLVGRSCIYESSNRGTWHTVSDKHSYYSLLN